MNNYLKDNKLKNQLVSVKPFVYIRPSISRISLRFIILLSIQVLMLLLTKSFNALFVVISSVLGATCAALLNKFVTKEPKFQIMAIIIQGLFIGLLLPETYPLIAVFFISFSTLIVSRCLIYKNINSWVNISVVAVIIAWFVGRKYFPSFEMTTALVTVRNASVYLIQDGFLPISSIDSSLTQYFNSTIFNWFKVSIPEGFITLLWDTHSTIPAFRFNIITIISSIVIFSDNSFSSVIPSLFLFVYALLVRLFAPFMFGGMFNQGDIILALLTSGTLFCAVFLIQWFGTIPISLIGKIFLGIISGILAFLIVGCGTSPIGMVYTVLITNIISMIIRVFEEKSNVGATAKVVKYLNSKQKGVQ